MFGEKNKALYQSRKGMLLKVWISLVARKLVMRSHPSSQTPDPNELWLPT
jgi:hypothetical protein